MAQIYRKDNDLRKQYQKNIENVPKNIISGIFVSVAFLIILLMGEFIGFTELENPLYLLATPFPILIGITASIRNNQQNLNLQKKIEDQENFIRIIEKLPDGYSGFLNVDIATGHKPIRIDMIIVGPTGVFAILVRNHGVNIIGNAENNEWKQKNTDSSGKTKVEKVANPLILGEHYAELFKSVLNKNGVSADVNAIIYYSNPNAILHIKGEGNGVPVFSRFRHEEAEMNTYITDREDTLTGDKIFKICDLLRG